MDYTQFIVGAIVLITTILLGLVTKQLIPWLKEKRLYDLAIIAVNAAEAIYGRYNGKQKLNMALNFLKEKGFNVETSTVVNAIEAAWKQLDQAMYSSGEKYIEQEE